jgi:hypothetical protein
MLSPTEQQLEAARRLLEQASGSNRARLEPAEAAGRVYETLFDLLAPIVGPAGVRALFLRSVKLTKTEFPHLGEVRVAVESPEANVQLVRQLKTWLNALGPVTASKAATRLYGTLLGLMTTFIGDQLVRHIVKGAFGATDDIGVEENG